VARPPIVLAPETLVHVTQRATDSETFVLDQLDRDAIVRLFAKTVDRYHLALRDYSVLSNHLHLVLRAPHGNLPRAMQYLGACLVGRFNRRHGRRGHLVQAPYRAKPVLTEGHVLWLRVYIAMNPVRAGLCRRPEDWRWSGYGGRGQLVPRPDVLTRDLVEAELAAFRRGPVGLGA
jgi:putative transposase